MGHAIAYLDISASISEATPQAFPGQLVLDFGDGQRLTSERQGSDARLHLDSPRMTPYGTPWSLTYETTAGVNTVVFFFVEVWPGALSPDVYAMTMMPR
jgi:hypothetical protein